MLRILSLVIILFSLLSVCSCDVANKANKPPQHLVIALLPDRNPEQLLKDHDPLFTYLSQKLEVSYEVIIPSSYEDLLNKFQARDIDMAFFGGITFTKAMKQSGAVPLVMRNIDLNFISYLIVHSDSQLNNIEMLSNMRFSFGSPLSTSGHIMPRYYMKALNIIPEEYFSKVQYSGSHTATINDVINKTVDAGVLNSQVFDASTNEKPQLSNELSIIWQSPPFPDYVWAIQPSFGDNFNQKIVDVFMSITKETAIGKKILNNQKADAFYPTSVADFAELEQALKLIEPNND